METRPLGPGAPEVTVMGFGGMPLSITDRPDENVAIGVIHAVLDAGVTLLDTADVYCLDDDDIGHNERLFAKALSSWGSNRAGVLLATKAGLTRPGGRWERDGRPKHIREACERSLRALGTDCIDLYQFHAPDPEVPFAESVGAFAKLREEGKVRHVGLSNVSVEQIEMARTLVPVVTVQNRLNPFFREAVESGVVAHCGLEGIGFVAYSPVGGGRLNKKLPDHPALTSIAQRLGISPHAVIIAWVMAQGTTVFPIPAGRTPAHVLDSLAATGVDLTAADIAAIDEAEFSRA